MNDESIMRFGKHKGTKLEDIPDDYFLWFWEVNLAEFRACTLFYGGKLIMVYIQDNLDSLGKGL
jgi:uncharacterized protein (DUF3820 family)